MGAKNNIASILGNLISVGLLPFVLCVLTIPLLVAVCISVLCITLCYFLHERHAAIMISLSSLIVILTLEIVLYNLPPENAPQYYRPEEVLIQKGELKHDPRFKPNREILDFNMPFGDLAALVDSPALRQKIGEPRTVSFKTDNLGHRNRSAYENQKYVIFGDSFVVGSGTDQKDILSEALTLKHGLPSYNAGYPGDLFNYVSKVKEMLATTDTNFQGVFVVFEGNDFKCDTDRVIGLPRADWPINYMPSFVQEMNAYRLFFGLTRRALFVLYSDDSNEHVKILAANEPIAFHTGYIKETRRKEACWHWVRIVEPLKEIAPAIRVIVFVPDKYRIYHRFISGSNENLLTVQSDFMRNVASELGIDYIDLTPALHRESAELLKENRYTWWRDDTHWNASGIEIAAREIASVLKGSSVRE